jgi:hypothetical protein
MHERSDVGNHATAQVDKSAIGRVCRYASHFLINKWTANGVGPEARIEHRLSLLAKGPLLSFSLCEVLHFRGSMTDQRSGGPPSPIQSFSLGLASPHDATDDCGNVEFDSPALSGLTQWETSDGFWTTAFETHAQQVRHSFTHRKSERLPLIKDPQSLIEEQWTEPESTLLPHNPSSSHRNLKYSTGHEPDSESHGTFSQYTSSSHSTVIDSSLDLLGLTLSPPPRKRRRLEQQPAMAAELLQLPARCPCPIFEDERRNNQRHTCNGTHAKNMSELRLHMTRGGGGHQPHLTFLKLCGICKNDFVDKVVFSKWHGKNCHNHVPQRRGQAVNAYYLAFSAMVLSYMSGGAVRSTRK